MGTIKLEGSDDFLATSVSNRFIDEYMPNANGEFVKIYLYLLRALSSPAIDISICRIADIFNHTEKDVMRALRYWEQAGLLKLSFTPDKLVSGIVLKSLITDDNNAHITDNNNAHITDDINTHITDNNNTHITDDINTQTFKTEADSNDTESSTLQNERIHTANSTAINNQTYVLETPKEPSPKKSYTANELEVFKAKGEVVEFLYLAQKYIGKPLSNTDVNTLLYIYDVLGFAPELIEYLIEYCVTNGHKSLRYIEKVAISWSIDDINTIDKARATTNLFSKNCYPVLKAFGLSGRNPVDGEKEMIVKWTSTYGFTMDIVLDACKRTMDQLHKPSFNYADSILTSWKKAGIHTIADIAVLDNEHQKTEAAKSSNSKANSANSVNSAKGNSNQDGRTSKNKNSFNDFSQRSYNYETLEKELLSNI